MITILRLAEKNYYDKIVRKNKSNVKLTWNKVKVSNFIHLFNKRLDSFIAGFRSNRSILMTLIELLEKLTNSIDEKTTLSVFIDPKKTFDTIDNELLEKNGILRD